MLCVHLAASFVSCQLAIRASAIQVSVTVSFPQPSFWVSVPLIYLLSFPKIPCKESYGGCSKAQALLHGNLHTSP